jgi:hypothetical protein
MSEAKTETRMTVNILNHHGDETKDMLLSEAFGLLDAELDKGMWVFNDSTNDMVTDKPSLRKSFGDGGSATVMPASVGG